MNALRVYLYSLWEVNDLAVATIDRTELVPSTYTKAKTRTTKDVRSYEESSGTGQVGRSTVVAQGNLVKVWTGPYVYGAMAAEKLRDRVWKVPVYWQDYHE